MSDRNKGLLAALLTVSMWAGWLVATRFAAKTDLAAAEIALFRYGIPALVLWPILLRRKFIPVGARPVQMLLIFAGGGLPYFFLGASGMQFAPAADGATMMPGTMPLWVALIAIMIFGEKFPRIRVAGFAFIALGALATSGGALLHGMENGAWRGHLLFLSASLSWAIYTQAYKRSHIDPWHASAFIAVFSTIGFLPLAGWEGIEHIMALPIDRLLIQMWFQGIGAGIVATWSYGYAVTKLGAPGGAAIGALTPPLATLAALVLIGEIPEWSTWVGVFLVSFGVLLTSGLLEKKEAA